MPTVAFMPYYPDRTIRVQYGTFLIWNWFRFKDRMVADAEIRNHIENYFKVYKRPDGKQEDRIAIVSSDGISPIAEPTSEAK
jgi:hypothetical protein